MIYKQFVRLQHVKTLKCRFYVISSHIKKHVSGQESPVSENAKKHMAYRKKYMKTVMWKTRIIRQLQYIGAWLNILKTVAND